MNRWTALTVAAVAAAAYIAVCIARLPRDDDTYWQGFADGELHNQLAERTPSLN